MVQKKKFSYRSITYTHEKAIPIYLHIFSNKHGSFFTDGPGGMEKTYSYCALLAIVCSKGFIALPGASFSAAHLIYLLVDVGKNSSFKIYKTPSARYIVVYLGCRPQGVVF